MSNKNKKRSGAVIKAILIIVLILAAFTAIYMLWHNSGSFTFTPESTESSISASKPQGGAEKESSTKPQESTEAPSENTTEKTTARASEPQQSFSFPMNINEALDALSQHYGPDYDVNSTIEEDGFNYFAIYKDNEKYASVKVNLETGRATETLASTGAQKDFNLV